MPACLCFTAAEGSGSPAGIHANMVLMWWMEGRKGEVKLTAEAGNTAWWENKLENCLLFYTILHSFRALLRWQAYWKITLIHVAQHWKGPFPVLFFCNSWWQRYKRLSDGMLHVCTSKFIVCNFNCAKVTEQPCSWGSSNCFDFGIKWAASLAAHGQKVGSPPVMNNVHPRKKRVLVKLKTVEKALFIPEWAVYLLDPSCAPMQTMIATWANSVPEKRKHELVNTDWQC